MRNSVTPPPTREARVEPKRIARQPHVPNIPAGRLSHHHRKHCWVQMKMQMAVDVIESQSRGMKLLELRRHFPFELFAAARIEEEFHPRRYRAIRKPLPRVDQIWNFVVR